MTTLTKPLPLLEVGRERIIRWAECLPGLARVNSLPNVGRASEHDGGETGLLVPEDVAMEHPGASVVGPETDDSSGASDTNNITADRVDFVQVGRAHGFNNPEVVSVQVERMCVIIIGGRELDLDGLVGGEDEGILGGVEISRNSCTSENLVEGRDLRGQVGDVVDVPNSLPSNDLKVKRDVEVGWRGHSGDQGTEVSFDERNTIGGAKGPWGGRFGNGGASVAQDGAGEGGILVQVTSWATTDEWRVDPVVCNRLVGRDHNRVTLAGEHLNSVDGVGCS